MSALKVSNMLDRLYLAFDALANKHEVFKVETIGDAWVGVTNCEFIILNRMSIWGYRETNLIVSLWCSGRKSELFACQANCRIRSRSGSCSKQHHDRRRGSICRLCAHSSRLSFWSSCEQRDWIPQSSVCSLWRYHEHSLSHGKFVNQRSNPMQWTFSSHLEGASSGFPFEAARQGRSERQRSNGDLLGRSEP